MKLDIKRLVSLTGLAFAGLLLAGCATHPAPLASTCR